MTTGAFPLKMLRLMTVAKPSLDRITKALAVAGAFVAFGCGEAPRLERCAGNEWVHRGPAQHHVHHRAIAPDSVPQAAIDAALEEVDIEMNAWREDLPVPFQCLHTDGYGVWWRTRRVWSLLGTFRVTCTAVEGRV